MVLSVQSTHSPALESCPSTYTSKPPLQMVLAMMYVPEVSVFERPVVLDLPQSLKAKENAVSSWLLQVAVSAADAETAISGKSHNDGCKCCCELFNTHFCTSIFVSFRWPPCDCIVPFAFRFENIFCSN